MEHPTIAFNRVCQHFHLNRGMIIQRVVMRIEKSFLLLLFSTSVPVDQLGGARQATRLKLRLGVEPQLGLEN